MTDAPLVDQIRRVIARNLTGDFAGAFLATEEWARIEATAAEILALPAIAQMTKERDDAQTAARTQAKVSTRDQVRADKAARKLAEAIERAEAAEASLSRLQASLLELHADAARRFGLKRAGE